METNLLSRERLESLSSADLVSLTEEYGIDIPDSLSRRFIIGELLELAEELSSDAQTPEMSEDDSPPPLGQEGEGSRPLPATFNETEIDFTFRNPVWLYAFWDISSSLLKRISSMDSLDSLCVRVSYFSSPSENSACESFDCRVSVSDREKFIMIKSSRGADCPRRFVRVDLVALMDDGTSENLALSRKVPLPLGSALLSDARPGRDVPLSPIYEASGMREVLRLHYDSHRESFA